MNIENELKKLPKYSDLLEKKDYVYKSLKYPTKYSFVWYILETVFKTEDYDLLSTEEIYQFHSLVISYIWDNINDLKKYIRDGYLWLPSHIQYTYFLEQGFSVMYDDFSKQSLKNIRDMFGFEI